MNNTNVMIAFLKELIARLQRKSPRFFVILQYIGIAAFLLTGLPELLQFLGIVLPDALAAIASKTVMYASAVFTILTRLAVVDATDLPFSNPKK